MIGPEDVIEAAKKVHDFLTVGAPAPLQEAVVEGLNLGAGYYEDLKKLYTEKRDYFLAGLDRIGLKLNVPQGTYFVMIDISEFLELEQFKDMSDYEFCEWMIKEIGVAAVPGSSFFREPVNNLIRLHFARGKDTLDEALRRLGKTECGVVVAKGLTEEQKKKYRLYDNKTSELASWDQKKLSRELSDVDFCGYDFGQPVTAMPEEVTDGEAVKTVVCPCCGEVFEV